VSMDHTVYFCTKHQTPFIDGKCPSCLPGRKQHPVFSGVMHYFPDAIMSVAHCSYVGNEQHNPGEKLNWSRHKSNDHMDAAARHMLQHEEIDDDGVPHLTKATWRLLAQLQLFLEEKK
jgi:hypothetical protein